MPPPITPPDDLCPRVAPHVERALQDNGWEEIRLACRGAWLHVAARCPGESAETPPAHFVLGPPALVALLPTPQDEDEAGAP